MSNRIEVKNISYSIDNKKILEDISLKVEEKKMVGIIGPNGSGKTTFLKHIYRTLPVSKNTVFINQRELNDFSYRETAKAFTVVKQENGTEFDFTVEEMVLLGRAPYHKSFEAFNKDDHQIAEEALEKIGMAEYKNRMFQNLSGGEKQRVLIARSLAQKADIMILDEPTNHLDVHYQWGLMDTIKDLNITVLGVFHEMNLAINYCDELYVLNKGRVVVHGKPKDIMTEELLEKVFHVDARVIQLEDNKPYIMIKGAKLA